MGREHQHDREDHDQKAHLKVVHEDVPPPVPHENRLYRLRWFSRNAVGLG